MQKITDEVSELEQSRIDAIAYINSAPTTKERQHRKKEMYHVLYTTSGQEILFERQEKIKPPTT
jgi:hypothetical protein